MYIKARKATAMSFKQSQPQELDIHDLKA